jgi:hypothetical protein
MVSFDLADGDYTLGIREEDMDLCTVNYRGTLYILAGLLMGWKCNSYYFCRLAEVLSVTYANHCPTPPDTPPYGYEPVAHATITVPTLYAKLAIEGSPITPVHGRLLVFADNRDAALQLRDRVF